MNTGFKYFPKKLYSKPVKMIAALSSAVKSFGMSRPSEIFYTIQNGNWNNPNVWETVSGRVGRIPTANDDVYIKHNIFIPSNTPMSCFNLFVSSTGLMDATTQIFATDYAVRVFGDFKCDGIISGIIIWLYGNNTFINREKNPSGRQFTIRYASTSDQPIFPMDYFTLSIAPGALGVKYLTENTTCQSFSAGGGSAASLEIGPYDFTCFGTFTNYFLTSCSGNGYLLFIGAAAFHGRSSIIGAPTIEFRGGVGPMFRSGLSATGFGQILFTTNNQSFSNSLGEVLDIDCPVTIGSGLSLTIASATVIQFNKIINGADGASSLINRATINFGTLESVASMTVGTFDRTTFANTVGYTGNYSATIPYTTYSSLTISGTGTKTLVANTTLSANLISTGTLECSTFNLTVNGTTNTQAGKLTKSGAGNVLFVGNLNIGNTLASVDFSVGNPTVECRGGMGFSNSNPNPQALRSGTGVWTFTTNNQTIRPWSTLFPITFDCPIIISGAITISLTQVTGTGGAFNLNNTINGNSASSTLTVGTGSILTFATAASVPSMTTGVFDRSTFANTVAYSGNYSATIPFNTFSSLTIGGTGTKTLEANTTLNGNLIVSAGVFDCSIYNLTVGGTTTCVTGRLSKTGAGNVLFIGNLNITLLDFSGGNPTVELRGGILFSSNSWSINSGTGTWTFTTNNQSLIRNTTVPGTLVFNSNVLISGAITVTNSDTGPGGLLILVFNESINGDNINSRLINKGTINMNNATYPQPMTTGILDITSFLNTIGFTFNGNYAIPYSSVRNLSIEGTGLKTLSTNLVISGTLNINAASLDLLNYNLTVNSTTSFNNNNGTNFLLIKSGPGNVIFGGLVTTQYNTYTIDFSSGNPSVEVRNGLSINQTDSTRFKSGTGTWSFTTNNQSIGITIYTSNPLLFSGDFYIDSNITLTYTNNHNLTILGTLNGGNSSSTLLIGTGTPTLNYRNTTQPMTTGILDTSTNLNTFIYGNGNQNIRGGNYRNLTFNGGGVKTLQGNVVRTGTYVLTPPATVNLNGFTLT